MAKQSTIGGVQEIMDNLLAELQMAIERRRSAYLGERTHNDPTDEGHTIRTLAAAIQQIATVNRW